MTKKHKVLYIFSPPSHQSLAGAGVSSVINESAQEHAEEQEEGEHENPMYTAFQNMLPEERQVKLPTYYQNPIYKKAFPECRLNINRIDLTC